MRGGPPVFYMMIDVRGLFARRKASSLFPYYLVLTSDHIRSYHSLSPIFLSNPCL
jgi:hypothetical protein